MSNIEEAMLIHFLMIISDTVEGAGYTEFVNTANDIIAWHFLVYFCAHDWNGMIDSNKLFVQKK